MTETVALASREELAAYDDFVLGQAAAELHHTSGWVGLVAKATGAEALFLAARDGETRAVMPVLLTKRMGLLVAHSPLEVFAPYGGVLGDAAALPLFEQALRARGCDFLDVYGGPRGPAEDAYRVAGFRTAHKGTFALGLSPSENALFEAFDSRCRRAIRKAEREGVSMRGLAERDLDAYWGMATSTYAKSRQPPPFPRAFHPLLLAEWKPRPDHGAGLIALVAEHGGRPVSAGFFPYWRGTVYYMDGASLPEAYDVAASNLVHWHLIREARARGLTRYDMVGASIPGIARFKESFGAQRAEYPHAGKALTLRGRAASTLYKALLPVKRRAAFYLRRR